MRHGMGRDHLTGKGFYLTVLEMIWNYVEVVVVQHCECVNVTELSIRKWLILCEFHSF